MPVRYELPPGEAVGIHTLVGGTFTWSLRHTRQIHFYQLPSQNRATDFKYWCIDVGIDFDAFWFDPEQDLLVLLQGIESQSGRAYKTYVRSMSTNEAHPRTTPDQSVTIHTTPSNAPDFDGIRVEIFGCSLAVILSSRVTESDVHVNVWDWTTGQQILVCFRAYLDILVNHNNVQHLNLGNRCFISFELLREDLFFICRLSYPSDTDAWFSTDTLGCLDVYQFSSAIALMEAVHVASFALPPEKKANTDYWATMQCAPAPAGSGSQSPRHSLAKVYDLASRDRLLYLDISTLPTHAKPKSRLVGTLYMLSSVLLDAVPKHGPQGLNRRACMHVPWTDWAHKASWVRRSKFRPSDSISILGQRMAGKQAIGDEIYELVVLDFDQRRLMSRDIDTPGDIHSITSAQERTKDKGSPCMRDARVVKMCTRTPISIEGGLTWSDRVWINDEHGGLCFYLSHRKRAESGSPI
jgi:hypothetical protein